MISDPEQYIHSALAELGPTKFLAAMSAVCMTISQQAGNRTDAEKACKNQWLHASAQASKLVRSFTQAGLTESFVMHRVRDCPRTGNKCDDVRCSLGWCRREEHYP